MRPLASTVQCYQQTRPTANCEQWEQHMFVLPITLDCLSALTHAQELPDDTDDGHMVMAVVPLVEEGEDDEDESTFATQDAMKIAWRYQGLPKVDVQAPNTTASLTVVELAVLYVQSSFSTQFGHSFDLTRRLSRERIDMVKKTLLDLTQRSDRYTE